MKRNRKIGKSPSPSQHKGGLALSRHGSKNCFTGTAIYSKEPGADNDVSSHITKLREIISYYSLFRSPN